MLGCIFWLRTSLEQPSFLTARASSAVVYTRPDPLTGFIWVLDASHCNTCVLAVLAGFFSQVLALFTEFAVFVPGVLRERKHLIDMARLKTLDVFRIDFWRSL